jgi:hypothetical protein
MVPASSPSPPATSRWLVTHSSIASGTTAAVSALLRAAGGAGARPGLRGGGGGGVRVGP